MAKKKVKKTLDEYMHIAKWDVYLYVFLTVVFSGVGFIGLLLKDSLIPLIFFLAIYVFIGIFFKVKTYFNMKIIISYIDEHNLKDKLGEIEYWNENSFFLTENYMIIKQKKKVYCFKYKDIVKIFYEDRMRIGRESSHSRFLHVVVDGLEEFVFLIQSTSITYQETKDIGEYLLKKNNNIIVDNNVDITKFNVSKW